MSRGARFVHNTAPRGGLGQHLPMSNLLEIFPQHLLRFRVTQPPQKQLVHLDLEHRFESHGDQLGSIFSVCQ